MNMTTPYDSLENMFLLESIANRRRVKLEDIAIEQMGTRKRMETAEKITKIVWDNMVTDMYFQRYFGQGVFTTPPEVTELHLRRCEESGVQMCICLANKRILTPELV